jgi:hypothetical protein
MNDCVPNGLSRLPHDLLPERRKTRDRLAHVVKDEKLALIHFRSASLGRAVNQFG